MVQSLEHILMVLCQPSGHGRLFSKASSVNSVIRPFIDYTDPDVSPIILYSQWTEFKLDLYNLDVVDTGSFREGCDNLLWRVSFMAKLKRSSQNMANPMPIVRLNTNPDIISHFATLDCRSSTDKVNCISSTYKENII